MADACTLIGSARGMDRLVRIVRVLFAAEPPVEHLLHTFEHSATIRWRGGLVESRRADRRAD